MINTKTMVICGVGGQGTILTTEVVSEALFQAGFDVKKNEIHGMSQRGGTVVGFVRYGEKVSSPMVGQGDADFVLSFEKLEALRHLPYLKKDGIVIVSEMEIDPIPVILEQASYPLDIDRKIKSHTSHYFPVDAMKIARELGNTKVVNMILTGVLSSMIPEVEEKFWLESLRSLVKPHFVEVNLKAFEKGRALLLGEKAF